MSAASTAQPVAPVTNAELTPDLLPGLVATLTHMARGHDVLVFVHDHASRLGHPASGYRLRQGALEVSQYGDEIMYAGQDPHIIAVQGGDDVCYGNFRVEDTWTYTVQPGYGVTFTCGASQEVAFVFVTTYQPAPAK